MTLLKGVENVHKSLMIATSLTCEYLCVVRDDHVLWKSRVTRCWLCIIAQLWLVESMLLSSHGRDCQILQPQAVSEKSSVAVCTKIGKATHSSEDFLYIRLIGVISHQRISRVQVK
jgi:hypothetical protein